MDLDDEEKIKSVEGKFVRLEQQGIFNQFIIKFNNGKEEKLWWFEFFEGADEFISKPDSFKNGKLFVKYRGTKVYDASLNDYRVIKIVTGLSKEKE